VGNRTLARNAWLVAFAGISVSPLLLISDLGKPSRFLNMLRVFKVTSPMSVGSWLLLLNGVAVAPAATYAWIGWPRRIGPPAQGVSAVLGMPLATYTAVLVANTAVPAWSEGRWGVPFGFAAGAAASAGAVATMITPPQHAAPARRLAVGGAIAETITGEAMERGLGEVGRPYREGTAGWLMRGAKTLSLGGAATVAIHGRRSRRWTIAGAAALLAGAALERWGVFRAGFQSAEDPAYTVGPQRERADERARNA
jgi:hypothetical protein